MRNYSHMLDCQGVMLLIYLPILSISLLFAVYNSGTATTSICLIQAHNNSKKDSAKSSAAEIITRNSVPLCINNLFNLRDYQFEAWAKGSGKCSKLIKREESWYSCSLLQYTAERLVTCLDNIYQNLENHSHFYTSKMSVESDELHFIFMGDSRIRQQFYNFLKFVPDYDRWINSTSSSKHDDISIYSNLLKMRTSFLWRPILNDNVIETVRLWTSPSYRDRPHFILISMEIHHMLKKNGYHQIYFQLLIRLGLALEELANKTHVVWLNQYPIVDFYGASGSENTEIHSQKVHLYNKIVRSILKEHRSIKIWDSSNPLAEEYVRGCLISKRDSVGNSFYSNPSMVTGIPFVNCRDYVHTGSVALYQAIQLLFNHFCNSVICKHHTVAPNLQ